VYADLREAGMRFLRNIAVWVAAIGLLRLITWLAPDWGMNSRELEFFITVAACAILGLAFLITFGRFDTKPPPDRR